MLQITCAIHCRIAISVQQRYIGMANVYRTVVGNKVDTCLIHIRNAVALVRIGRISANRIRCIVEVNHIVLNAHGDGLLLIVY